MNNSSQTLNYENSSHNSQTEIFNLENHVIKPNTSTYFHGSADVSAGQLNGLGGTIEFNLTNSTKFVDSSQPFIIGDDTYGWRHMPIFGFGINNSLVESTLSNVIYNKKTMPYDIQITSATVTINNKG